MKRFNRVFLLAFLIFTVTIGIAFAATPNIPVPKVNISVDSAKNPKDYVDNIKLLILLTSLTFIPAIILLMT
ncbi:MAG: flagellar biosynthetic protein FliP, partial [Caloramator sp.]|nr:flagellar biosynthetic protein FliP [Caloramator sp.]